MNSVEIVGICPHCFKGKGKGLTDSGKKVGREVDIYAEWNKDDVLDNLYIWGDEHFDMLGEDSIIREIGFSDDQKHVNDIVCPRCKEHVPVNIPIVRTKTKMKPIGEEKEEKNFKQVG